jgi:hypothetical protein
MAVSFAVFTLSEHLYAGHWEASSGFITMSIPPLQAFPAYMCRETRGHAVQPDFYRRQLPDFLAPIAHAAFRLFHATIDESFNLLSLPLSFNLYKHVSTTCSMRPDLSRIRARGQGHWPLGRKQRAHFLEEGQAEERRSGEMRKEVKFCDNCNHEIEGDGYLIERATRQGV